MFSNIIQKAALFGARTVAGIALTGTMMANSAQAATMSYRSEFSVTSNRLNSEVVTGDFSFTKTELDSGFFSYKLTDFNTSVGAFGFNKSLTLDDVKENPVPFLALNQTLVEEGYLEQKYQSILPSVLLNEDSNYVGDGDFPPNDFMYEFSGEKFATIMGDLTPLVSALLPSVDTEQVTSLANVVFGAGGEINFTTTAVPEPTTIFALGVIGVGLTATRRKHATKKNKQKTAA